MTPQEDLPATGPPKLADVAARAGVSTATASRVLNGGNRFVGEPHRGKVLAAAAELGYTPNAHAQAVARGSSNVLGLIVHDVTDPYFADSAYPPRTPGVRPFADSPYPPRMRNAPVVNRAFCQDEFPTQADRLRGGGGR